jgi:hypothetical protein
MHSLRGKRGLIGGLMFALAAAVALPVTAHAGPDPEAKRPNTGRYRLFAGNLGAITINRVYYGLNTRGEVGVDSLNSSTIGGGFWPKGTGNQYMFNSGLQVAGIITGGAENPWAGDTTGGMFFDASGLRQHGTAVSELYNAVSPVDQANWPQAGFVPQGDASEELFDDLLRGRMSASQGDVWFMSSEADPGLNAARPHPLGIIAEYRVMGWNFPTGNEDLLYLIVTFYNITSNNPADYAQYRPGLREILIEQANQFHALNNAAFNVDLPDAGYTIDPFYAAFAADPDVTNSATVNFASVNLPFAMGYTYHADFPRAAGWTFSPNIFGAPFFAGAGFVGIKYLKSATGPGEIALFSNTTNGGAFPDPPSAVRLYKYMSGTITPADGVACNHGDPLVSRICYVGNVNPADVRMMQSSTPIALAAGASASIVVSYIHAAPVQIPGYVGGTRVLPGDPRRLTDAALLAAGANRVDSIMGFRGFTDQNSDGIVQQEEMSTVPGSLLRKALVAQEVFNNKFLLPFAPEAPEFFLIPGDGQVTVMWRPSATETQGDPYFAVAKDAAIVPEGGGAPVPNALYDANYRQFDVEGYRIYRGRSDTPTGLQLIAQYDYAGTRFRDFTGQVVADARGARCAPELGVTTTCAGVFNTPTPGVQLVNNVAYDINGNLVQVQIGNRTLLASGDVINLVTDTAVVGGNSGFPALSNTGVPFIYVDNDVRNGLTYFYAVTAFDVNSISSTGAGFTSLESARISKRVVPGSRASNFVNEGNLVVDGVYGRGVKLTDATAQTIDPATGMFDKKAPPSNGLTAQIAGFVRSVVSGSGQISIRLDSITLGDPNANVPHNYFYSAGSVGSEQRSVIALNIDPSETNATVSASTGWAGGSADPALAALYGGGEGFGAASGTMTMSMPGSYFTTIYGRGCVNNVASGVTQFGTALRQCSYNGPRWFSGDNETEANPNDGNYGEFNLFQGAAPVVPVPEKAFAVLNNAGALPGVVNMMRMHSYENTISTMQNLESILSGGFSAGDFRVYWGGGGVVDSVIDLTHNVPVPFSERLSATWGILNQSATTAVGSFDQRPTVLTIADIGCVIGLRGKTNGASYACSSAAPWVLSQTAIPGTIADFNGPTTNSRTHPVAANNGIVFYIKGYPFLMELAGGQVPAAGTEWTLRTYVGGIAGGNGPAGSWGDYVFTPVSPRPFQAIGTELVMSYDVTNTNIATTSETLAEVHTVPDPYYVTSALEATTTSKKINFVNLPANATIRIYTTSGVLVRALVHATTTNGGETTWDVRNRNNQFVASGVYFYHVTAENGETTVGRMTIINYAQ